MIETEDSKVKKGYSRDEYIYFNDSIPTNKRALAQYNKMLRIREEKKNGNSR